MPLYGIGIKRKDSVVAIGKFTINESEYEKLLGDEKFSFTNYVQDLCKKAHQKLHALARLSNYIDPIKLKLLMDVFIKSQFTTVHLYRCTTTEGQVK